MATGQPRARAAAAKLHHAVLPRLCLTLWGAEDNRRAGDREDGIPADTHKKQWGDWGVGSPWRALAAFICSHTSRPRCGLSWNRSG